MLHTFLTLALDYDNLPGSHAMEGRAGVDVLAVPVISVSALL
jgi:hypothetical protein